MGEQNVEIAIIKKFVEDNNSKIFYKIMLFY